MPTVSVKWQKEVFPAVEIDTEQPPYVFKCQLYDLTGVPPDRQKIMIKGGLLKDDGDWSKLGLKQGQKLMMMGTADEIPKAPEKGPVFVEDLPEEEQNVASLGYTAGLVNLGNTCYMNSTIQCLHSVPELKASLQKHLSASRHFFLGAFLGSPSLTASEAKASDCMCFKYSLGVGSESDPSSHSLTLATRDLFGDLDRSHRPVAPDRFLKVLRTKYPQFAQMAQGIYMQQDAEECWTQLLYTLSLRLRVDQEDRSSAAVVKQLFAIDLTNVVKCAESGEESTETESVYTVKCHISHDVNHLHEGLKQGLKSELEKISPTLGRSALYVKESLISQLPPYLTVQFVRFFWKRESGQKAKILRKVDYPLVLDVLDLCTDELKAKLKGPREALRKAEDEKAGLEVKGSAAKDKTAPVDLKADQGKKSLKEEDTEMVDSAPLSNASGDDNSTGAPSSSGHTEEGTQLTGIYDLVAVLTHKGRSADSGHYVAWVKQESGKWIEFDDENPIPQREEDITKLSGGGDWHMAYICMYKARIAPPVSGVVV